MENIKVWEIACFGKWKILTSLLKVSSIAWNSEYKEMVTGHGFSHNQLTVWRYPRLEHGSKSDDDTAL